MATPVPLAELPAPSVRPLTDQQGGWLEARFPSVPTSPAQCVTCGGKKRFRWYTPDRTDVVDYACPCVAQYLLHRRLLYSGVGLGLQRIGWADGTAIPAAARQVVERYLADAPAYVDAGLGLVLSGVDRGVGKTMCAALTLKTLVIEHQMDGYMTTFARPRFRDQVEAEVTLGLRRPVVVR